MSVQDSFEGSYLGDAGRLDDAARLECGVCWHVYDPADGDPVWEIAPGTPFSALPDHWRCPNCDAPREKFLAIGTSQGVVSADPQRARVAKLVEAFRSVATQMRTLPVYNPMLGVDAVGFRPGPGGLAGVLITPWAMNLTFLPDDSAGLIQGGKRVLVFPSGSYEFTAGEVAGFGWVESCSLFSPMAEFAEMEVARMAAGAAADGLFTAESEE